MTSLRGGTAVRAASGTNPIVAPPSVLGPLVGGTDLERWYGLILAFPDTAVRLLTEKRVPDPLLLAVLRAQTHLRLDQPREAAAYARAAVEIAGSQTPIRPEALLPAATVLADAAVVAGAPDAVASCGDLIGLSAHFRDEARRLVGLGLEAVATFHQRSCQEAARLLVAVRGVSREPEVEGAIALAAETLTVCCARRRERHWTPATRPMITACGWVPFGLTRPFLADRLLRWPGVHDCAATAMSGRRA